MSDDILEFIEQSEKFSEPTKPTTPPRFSLEAIMKDLDADDGDDKKVTPGTPNQYALFGPGYMPTTHTIPTLPPGCYDIQASQQGVFAVPALPPTGLLLELPEMRSDEVIKIVETFWDSEKDYKEGNEFVIGGASYKAGIMIFGAPGCHAKGQGILMHDGAIKKVEDIVVGDKLMGPDSQPREVLKLARGREEMVRIYPTKGNPFVVNKSHILHLTPSGTKVLTTTPVNLKFKDWLHQNNNFKERYKLTRSSTLEFKKKDLTLDPYFLGIWLGDGTSRSQEVTSMDNEIVEMLKSVAEEHSMQLKIRPSNTNGLAEAYAITNGMGQTNPVLTKLRNLNVLNNKHIPLDYKTAGVEQRLELLAGLIDSDGSLDSNGFDFVNKNEKLIDDVIYLARSLGLAAYKTETKKSSQNGTEGTYFRIFISGETSKVPTRLERKKANERKQIKDVLRTGFEYELLPEDDFYGFSLDKDHLYLTDDFTIHHNTGKSCTIKLVSRKLVSRGGTVFYSSGNPNVTMSFLEQFSRIEKNRKCIVILEDLDSLIYNYGESAYLEMLDSAKTIDNVLFIATTNYPDKLDPRIYNRPGRFSHVVKVGVPGPAARTAYLKAVLKNHRDVEEIVSKSEGFSIDHLSALVNAVYREKKDLGKELERLRKLFKVPKSEDDRKLGL